MDTFKLVIAVLIAVSAVFGFYFFADEALWIRMAGLVGCASIAAVIALQTEKGRYIWGFFQDAQMEVRRVVWPTRQETLQTTLIVILMVVFVAIILWLLDMFLGWSIRSLMGQGG